ncbi:MAG: mscL [Phycisphaerales bacterium]|nr:mscL [Phycisphaerales bacterium]
MAIDYRSKAALVTGRTGTLWGEFKNFAFKGNLIDLAVAVVLGASFAKVIDAIVKGIIMPLISYVDFGKSGGYETWHIGRLQIGFVLAELLNFTLVALAVFIVIVKVVGALLKRAAPPPPAGEPTSKECPYCLMTIPLKAQRCGHCTSELTS